MKKSLFIIFILWLLQNGVSYSQTLQVTLSPDKSKVDRSTQNDVATIFFDSSIEGLSIICTDENPDESLIKINDNLWYTHIDVKKDIESDGICYRNYLLKCPASSEYFLTTEEIEPNRVLYYTVTLPNELEPILLREQSKNLAAKANELIDEGDSYTACLLALEILPKDLNNPNRPYTLEAEIALRNATMLQSAILKGQENPVEFIAFSPDGKRLVSASDYDIKIWDAYTGQLLHSLGEDKNSINSLSFSFDSQRIVSSSLDKICIWETNTGKCLHTITSNNSFPLFSYAAFSPDGMCIVSSSLDKTVRIWDAKTGKPIIHPLEGHKDFVISATYSPDGKYIFSVSKDNTVRTWDVNTGKCIQSLTLEEDFSKVNYAAFSPDCRHIVSSSLIGDSIRIWDANTGKCFHLKASRLYSVQPGNPAVFSSDGRRIVLVSDKNISIYDTNNGNYLQNLGNFTDYIYTASFCPDNQHIVYASKNKGICILNTNIPLCHKTLRGHKNDILSAIYSPDGKLIASASGDHTLRIWDVATGQCLQILKGHISRVRSVDFSSDGRHIVSASSDGTIRIWDINSLHCIKTLKNRQGSVASASFSPDGKYILSVSGMSINIWDVNSGECIRTMGYESLKGLKNFLSFGTIDSAFFSPDGRNIVSASKDGNIRIWDANTGECLQSFEGPNYYATYSPDGRYIASASNTICIWDVETKQCIHTMKGHSNYVTSVAFSPDSQYVVSASHNEIGIWDVSTGKCLQIIKGYTSYVHSVAFSPDGRHIVSASDDMMIRILDFLPLQQLIDETRERFKERQLTPEEKAKYNLE